MKPFESYLGTPDVRKATPDTIYVEDTTDIIKLYKELAPILTQTIDKEDTN